MFDGSRISTLDTTKVKIIAEENESTRLKRIELQNKKQRLDEALRIAAELCSKRHRKISSTTAVIPVSHTLPTHVTKNSLTGSSAGSGKQYTRFEIYSTLPNPSTCGSS